MSIEIGLWITYFVGVGVGIFISLLCKKYWKFIK